MLALAETLDRKIRLQMESYCIVKWVLQVLCEASMENYIRTCVMPMILFIDYKKKMYVLFLWFVASLKSQANKLTTSSSSSLKRLLWIYKVSWAIFILFDSKFLRSDLIDLSVISLYVILNKINFYLRMSLSFLQVNGQSFVITQDHAGLCSSG